MIDYDPFGWGTGQTNSILGEDLSTKLLFQIAYNEDSLCETKSGCRAAKENSGNQEYSILLTDIIALNSFQAAKNTKFSHSNIFSGGNFARRNF